MTASKQSLFWVPPTGLRVVSAGAGWDVLRIALNLGYPVLALLGVRFGVVIELGVGR